MSETMQNNRIYHRDWFDKTHRRSRTSDQGGKQGIVAGFEYAVQPDGSSLAERQWEVRQNPSGLPFEFLRVTEGGEGKLYQTSLKSIEFSVTSASQQYQQKSSYPERPSDHDDNVITSGAIPTHPDGPAFLSPTPRVRNRHNAVYGQHLPNALNSPGCAMKVFGNQSILKEERDKIKNLLHRNSGQNQNKENFPPARQQPATHAIDIDVDDSFLADIDVDKLVAQRGRQKESTQKTDIEFDYGHDEGNGGISLKSSNCTLDLTHGNSLRSPYPLDSFENPQAHSSSNFDSSVAVYRGVGGVNALNEGPRTNGGLGSFDSERTDYPFARMSDYNMEVTSSSCHPDDSGGACNFLPVRNSYQGPSISLPTSDNGETPLCPGHNRPCRLLTANTSANSGRQFYKCSMPDGDQCDFFEWIEGQEGNWNQNDNFGGLDIALQHNRGHILDIYQENRRKFGHSSFRPGQKDVIEHAMQGQDVFVLMPTGGGKSLCYQLPAWCSPGLSIVISPLLSLIQDQVQSLTKLGVESVFLNSAQDYETEQKNITSRLFNATDHGGIKLLYITPEKLRHSNMTQNILKRLYDKNLLSRFVVDEAHCMSDWAHDFRPDYGQLGMLRREYPNVPMMALTATANEKVVNDAIKALGMRNEYRFKSSFNRPNLHYKVVKKDGKSIDKIGEYIVSRPQDCGVIYCLSRKDCETLSEALQKKLNEKGCGHVRVSFYHAELDDLERTRRHHAWSSGKISVLCATIAFGMGIDKPDVRFVIHFSMPKSITHYYQESGRAGRDGAKADCILYYAYKDKKVLEAMIRKGSTNPDSQSTRRKVDQLYTCLRYCENEFICRRTMQLEFFGEKFDKSKCGKTCDNCKAGLEAERRNLTHIARELLQLLQSISMQRNGRGVTMVQLTELYKGTKSATKFLNVERLTGFGAGKSYSKSDLDRIAHAMVYDKILLETAEQNGGGFTSDYIRPGDNALATQNGQRPFFVEFPIQRSDAVVTKRSVSAKKEKAPPKKKSPKEKQKLEKGLKADNGTKPLSDWEISGGEEEDEEDDMDDRKIGSKASASPRVLPLKKTQALVARIKKLVGMWADEEQMNGNRVFYWNIISHDATAAICNEVPTTMSELHGLGVLGENVVNEYGERLVKNINAFITTEDLQKYIDKRPLKRPKTSDSNVRTIHGSSATKRTPAPFVTPYNGSHEIDEFDTEIDFGAIALPKV